MHLLDELLLLAQLHHPTHMPDHKPDTLLYEISTSSWSSCFRSRLNQEDEDNPVQAKENSSWTTTRLFNLCWIKDFGGIYERKGKDEVKKIIVCLNLFVYLFILGVPKYLSTLKIQS